MKAVAKPSEDGSLAVRQRIGALRRDESRFRLALAAALLAHALFLVGFYTAPERRLGAPGGAEDSISVDLATNADLAGTATVADHASSPMKPTLDASEANPATETPVATPETAEPAQPPEPKVADLSKLPELQKPAEKPPEQPAQQKSEPPQQTPLRLEDLALPGLDTAMQKPPPPPKKAPSEQKQEQKQEHKPAPKTQEQKQAQPKRPQVAAPKLDLNLPQSAFERPTFMGGGAGLERPAGITRSGENDDFARGVILALQRTMPQLSNTRGKVTVRILLDNRGNLVSTQVVRKSDVAGLDQNVVFATKQSSFPIPPRRHVAEDLVFLVTYIYR